MKGTVSMKSYDNSNNNDMKMENLFMEDDDKCQENGLFLSNGVEDKLYEASIQALSTSERLNHEDVFGMVRTYLNIGK